MISHPTPENVVSELGDKVTSAIVHAVKAAKEEFRKYRQQHPGWAADNAARTIAGIIHDWMWTDLRQQLESLPHVFLTDQDPKREIAVQVHSQERLSYLLRIKLHHLDGSTSSYQTQSVIDFEMQGANETFPGMGEVRLEAGYEWDKNTREMGAPVLSLRHGRNKVIWVHELPDQGAAGGTPVARPAVPGPTTPGVEVAGREPNEETGSDHV